MTVRELMEALRRLPVEARGLDVLAVSSGYYHRVSEAQLDPKFGAVVLRELPPPAPTPPPEKVAGKTTCTGSGW